MMNQQRVKTVETQSLYIAYGEHGPESGWPVILSHGFPYDVHAFDEVAVILARAGARVITPYTRGFGPTRFVSSAILRNGQQTARARDIVQLADALGLQRPILGGFGWGGNASCVAAALWRRNGLVAWSLMLATTSLMCANRSIPPSLRWSGSFGISTSFKPNVAGNA